MLLVTPGDAAFGVVLSVVTACAMTFFVAWTLLKWEAPLGDQEGEGFPCKRISGCKDLGSVEPLIADPRRPLVLDPPSMAKTSFLPNTGFILEKQTDPLVRSGLGFFFQHDAEVFF